jgi:hypothetical protein
LATGTTESWTKFGTGTHALYTYDGVAAVNYATSGGNALFLDGGGGTGGFVLSSALPLDTQEYTSLTISFNWYFIQGSSTRKAQLDYSSDGGSNWQELTEFNTPFGGSPPDGSTSLTINEGSTYTFSDTALFRFTFDADRASRELYLDDIVITGEPTFVPEPSTAWMALLSLGLLAIRRRR